MNGTFFEKTLPAVGIFLFVAALASVGLFIAGISDSSGENTSSVPYYNQGLEPEPPSYPPQPSRPSSRDYSFYFLNPSRYTVIDALIGESAQEYSYVNASGVPVRVQNYSIDLNTAFFRCGISTQTTPMRFGMKVKFAIEKGTSKQISAIDIRDACESL
ncbi:MAG: hypothetical protein A2806_01505 [Candidatus Terrybacteria bacterium RIFCSPHIGHO2_01_FULL_48_17]|uniref:Uncharacterized protein n=1 Tax=Candidatus Terrybacteria bacterium RIFCSPHIGHO2_01_FULL_48_17 TaxID=1802362 RepID=A0A1G2PHE6_9BACT|nr:MAG: hypothetical protein A2806_01505 [Candidatus Terrybacteria bacterium RIFCSPHIGHO2_01_FULL_48_17]